jgi:hypothetical protein
MPWWGILITVLAGLFVLVTLVWLVVGVSAYRRARRSFDQTWDHVNGSLWGAEFENRPRDPYRRLPRPQSRFDQR